MKKAKRLLSSAHSCEIEIEQLENGQDYTYNLSRAKFEDLCKDLFNQCLPVVESVLKDSKLKKSQIHEVILVGGSTRIPKI